ncbi:hypothetical protein [Flavobacterium sp.]|uniref:hypothetical protein n=1 Tax=Flavobacterium sp. TaxID=239 RepID=UPI0037506BBB
MSYNMLDLYNFNKINNSEFKITFEIPDNYFYNFSELNGEYFIAIKLNPGQTQPSTSFVGHSEKALIINQTLVTKFEQYEKSGVLKNPTAVIGG